jgi:hypothetical protein
VFGERALDGGLTEGHDDAEVAWTFSLESARFKKFDARGAS